MTPAQAIAELAELGLPAANLREAVRIIEAMAETLRAPEAARKERNRARVAASRARTEANSNAVCANTDEQDVTVRAKDFPSSLSPTPPITTPHSKTIHPSAPEGVADEVSEAVEAWNTLAHDLALPKVQKLTEQRRSSLKARLRDAGGIAGWHTAMAKIHASPFLTGDNRDNWRCDFDFVLQAKSFTKLMEGGYDGKPRNSNPNGLGAAFDRFEERFGIGDRHS